jgi:hypothetical protein
VSANPRRVLSTGYITWPPGASVQTYVRRGSLVDAAPGSALETAYGPGNLEPVTTDLGSADTLNKAWLAN